jgi:NADP-dependent 3-hydroxy acid dehydrogenase YdfG
MVVALQANKMYHLRVPPVKNTRKQLLVVGGTSSFAPFLMQKALENDFFVHATYRDKSKIRIDRNIQWHLLDLSNIASIEDFLDSLVDMQFTKIIILSGSLYPSDLDTPRIESLQDYYSTNLSVLVYLILKLVAHLEANGTVSVMLSRAARSTSFDFHYSSVKSGLKAFIESYNPQLSDGKRIYGISTGLVENSRMFHDMPKENREKHRRLAGGKLITLVEVCESVWAIGENSNSENHKSIVELEPVY